MSREHEERRQMVICYGKVQHCQWWNGENTAWNKKHSVELFYTEMKWIVMSKVTLHIWREKSLIFPADSLWRLENNRGLWRQGIPVQRATQQPDSSCLCRRDILAKVLEQFLPWYFFTSEWVCRWALRLDRSAKALLQCGQEKGFSPVGWEKRNVLAIRNRSHQLTICLTVRPKESTLSWW